MTSTADPHAAPAGRTNSRTGVIAEMRRRIISGEFVSGENLSEIALAEEFGVSRTPVREALKQLQTEGLVEIRPRVGTFVTTPSRREIVELFEMKELLEGAAVRLLAGRGHVPEVIRLQENVRESDAVAIAGDRERYAQLVEEFHELLIQGSDNSKLQVLYRMLMNQLAYARLVSTSLAQPGRLVQSEREHHRVLDLILAKDGDSAERVMREHVRASRGALLRGLLSPRANHSRAIGADRRLAVEPEPPGVCRAVSPGAAHPDSWSGADGCGVDGGGRGQHPATSAGPGSCCAAQVEAVLLAGEPHGDRQSRRSPGPIPFSHTRTPSRGEFMAVDDRTGPQQDR